LNDEVYVSDSSATKWKKDASADLKYLRGLPTAPHGATIHGTVFRYAAPENPKIKEIRPGIPQVGQRVQIHGTSQDYATAVDGHGDFNLSGLPPGALYGFDKRRWGSHYVYFIRIKLVENGGGGRQRMCSTLLLD
jgi:hypothetical protein